MNFLYALFDRILEPMAAGGLFVAGIFTGIKTRFVQFRCFGDAMRLTFGKKRTQKEGISSFGAAMMALAGTLGTGNMIGVGSAIAVGGAGAVLWMVIAAWIGMAVKYTEISLACQTRIKTDNGFLGGPMYYIRDWLHADKLSKVFAVCCILTGFGIGNLAQTSAVGMTVRSLHLSEKTLLPILFLMAFVFALCLYFGLGGGEKRVAKITSVLTPVMACGYLAGCLILILLHYKQIPQALAQIVCGAFSIKGVAGGVTGIAVSKSIKTGFTRGMFTNESGLGSAPIVHAASGEEPHTAGLWGIFEVFFDTVVTCSITGITLLVGSSDTLSLHSAADVFSAAFGDAGTVFLSAALVCFALAAALGWGFYGNRCLLFLTGGKQRFQKLYALLFSVTAFCGFFSASDGILLFADTSNSVMLLINTVSILLILCADCTQIKENRIIQTNIDKTKRKQEIN